MKKTFCLLFALFFLARGGAAAQLPATEKIEWTWTDRVEKPAAALPNVLLVGDSVTRSYFPAVVEQLAGVANVYLFATSAADDARLPAQLRDYFAMIGVRFSVVHFNNGMHGWAYTEQQYASGLPAMIAALRAGAPGARLIWATTTPVLKDSTDGATNARIDARNRLATARMARENIPVDDQHARMLLYPEMHSGDVHFNEAGSLLQAAQAVQMIRTALEGH